MIYYCDSSSVRAVRMVQTAREVLSSTSIITQNSFSVRMMQTGREI